MMTLRTCIDTLYILYTKQSTTNKKHSTLSHLLDENTNTLHNNFANIPEKVHGYRKLRVQCFPT